MKFLTQKKYQDHVPCSFAYKLVCVDDEFTKPIFAFRGENAAYEFIKAIFKEYQYYKIVTKKQFRSGNTCWICEKLIDHEDEKVRDHCHVTSKFRGAAHCSCNINLQLTKKVPVIFHNLRGYDSQIPHRLEKYMTFF